MFDLHFTLRSLRISSIYMTRLLSEAADISTNNKSVTLLNAYLTNGFSHHYQFDESTFIFRGVRSDSFFDEISVCKQNSPRWDAAICCCLPMSHKRDAMLK